MFLPFIILLCYAWLYYEYKNEVKSADEIHKSMIIQRSYDFIKQQITTANTYEQLVLCRNMIEERLMKFEAKELAWKLAGEIQFRELELQLQHYPVIEN